MRPRGGFTLLELLVVLTLAAIVMATALPRISSTMQRSPLTGAATAISADLRLAQAIAGRQRMPVYVVTDTVNKRVRIRDYTTGTLFHSVRYLNEDSEFPLAQLSVNDTSVLVYPNGTTANAFVFTLRVSALQRTVTMTRAGQIRVAE